MKNIIIILGTSREGRQSEKVAHFVLDVAKKRSDASFSLIDILDFPQNKSLSLSKEKKTLWQSNLKKADALLIISPEYNHSYPGELKLFLDNEYEAYRDKVAAICGVSSGNVGGARMIEQLKLVLNAFEMRIIKRNVFFSLVNDIFAEDGEVKEKEIWTKRVNELLDDIITALK
jgi:NAD(P)H-dependent FMN reductase